MTNHRITRGRTLSGSDQFGTFYADEVDRQVRRAFLLVGDPALAHDVVATAFTAVFQRWEQINEPGPYLNRCVLNACRDAGRRKGREHLVAEPDAIPVRHDEVDELADLLVALPFRQRAAIVLRFYGGYSEKEIARDLECRPGTVGSLIHRALKTLRRQISEQDLKQ